MYFLYLFSSNFIPTLHYNIDQVVQKSSSGFIFLGKLLIHQGPSIRQGHGGFGGSVQGIILAHDRWDKSFFGCLIVGHSVLDALMVCQAARVVIGHCATFIAALQVARLNVDIVYVTA